jgi:hypothetical protein
MGFDPNDKKAWRDFAHTTGVLLGAALAEFEVETRQDSSPEDAGADNVFVFQLMAAASDDAFHFADGAVQARGGEMTASLGAGKGEMRLELQLIGYTALRNGAGREARLRSEDGVVDQIVQFDELGSATCRLPDQPAVRQALNAFTVEILS